MLNSSLTSSIQLSLNIHKLSTLHYNNYYISTLQLNKILKYSSKSNYRYFTFNLFKLYFVNAQVDTPKSLINFRSLTRESNNLVVYKFVNYLMSNGYFLKTLIVLNQSWVLTNYKTNISLGSYNWYSLCTILGRNSGELFEHSLYKLNLNRFLIRFIHQSYSIFSLYIYKINKNIYKNTRGKSGKFMFI